MERAVGAGACCEVGFRIGEVMRGRGGEIVGAVLARWRRRDLQRERWLDRGSIASREPNQESYGLEWEGGIGEVEYFEQFLWA